VSASDGRWIYEWMVRPYAAATRYVACGSRERIEARKRTSYWPVMRRRDFAFALRVLLSERRSARARGEVAS
jgi:hypothetical protein